MDEIVTTLATSTLGGFLSFITLIVVPLDVSSCKFSLWRRFSEIIIITTQFGTLSFLPVRSLIVTAPSPKQKPRKGQKNAKYMLIVNKDVYYRR